MADETTAFLCYLRPGPEAMPELVVKMNNDRDAMPQVIPLTLGQLRNMAEDAARFLAKVTGVAHVG